MANDASTIQPIDEDEIAYVKDMVMAILTELREDGSLMPDHDVVAERLVRSMLEQSKGRKTLVIMPNNLSRVWLNGWFDIARAVREALAEQGI